MAKRTVAGNPEDEASKPAAPDEALIEQDSSKPAGKDGNPSNAKPTETWWTAVRNGNNRLAQEKIKQELEQIIAKYKSLSDYEILFLFDDDSIGTFHSDRLYSAASHLKENKKDILLIVHSAGGRIEPAYLISKTLKRIAAKKFSVAVPRRAKSAATLLALGADEIHMGMISQLGPIDPQLSGLPVLALGNALNHVADMACKYPAAADMLTKYLIDQVPIRILGYYERVSESAAQYAERLLTGKTLSGEKTAAEVAKHLVEHYKDHSFVIDTEEAVNLLGDKFVREQTDEYALSDEIYKFLEVVEILLDMKNLKFWLVGSLDGVAIREKPEK